MSEEIQATRSREDFFRGFLDHLTVPFLKPIAEGFFGNIKQVESLILMPITMFSMLEVDWQILALNTPIVNPAEHPDFMDRTRKRLDKTLAIPTCGDFLRTSMQVLYSASVSASWTALECLATDLWVTSLNEEPLTLAQTAIASLGAQDPGELTSKQIPVGLAARHGFDLRRCLGTVLKSKFDFTGVSGIQKAYKVFVPNDEFIEKVLSGPELDELEATRHVIVHRAGKVDEEYRKRTSSNLPPGTVLTFSEEQSARFSRVSAHAGIGLLAFVNDWLVKKKASG